MANEYILASLTARTPVAAEAKMDKNAQRSFRIVWVPGEQNDGVDTVTACFV